MSPRVTDHQRKFEPSPHALGEYLKQARERKGWSNREVSRQIGVHYSYITRIEQGHYSKPSPEILKRLANALEVPEEDLFALAGHELPENLPTFPAYLRSKYDMSPEVAKQLTDYFTYVKDRYHITEKDDHPSTNESSP